MLLADRSCYLNLADATYVRPLIERIGNVQSLPLLLLGGQPIGDYFTVREMQQSGELYVLLAKAGISIEVPEDPPLEEVVDELWAMEDDGKEEPEVDRSLGVGIFVGFEELYE